jgi:hypothetical protein
MCGLIAKERSLPDNLWMERKVRKSIYRVVKKCNINININERYIGKKKT